MFDSLRSLSDNQVLSSTDAIAAQDRQLTLKLLVHLSEIERRKLYLKLGYGSMFIYCTTHLRLSEPAAARRIRTARCLARIPELYTLLESGDVNLSTVSMVAKYMKPENAATVIDRIRGKSRREVERFVAEFEPRSVLPPDRVQVVMVPLPTQPFAASPRVTVAGDSEKSPNSEMTMEPFSAIQFTARQEFMAKVERARALVWHQAPNPTFEQLFELGLDELIARRDPEHRQKRRELKKRASRKARGTAGKRHVPAAVRDQVFVRDGFRCSYVGPDGRRCTATVALQVDHIRPVARGGGSGADNLRILCAEHNRLEASRIMGISESPQYVRESRLDYLPGRLNNPDRPATNFLDMGMSHALGSPAMQLELALVSAPDVAPPRVVASSVLQRHRAKNDVLRDVAYVRRYFPELDGETVTVGITKAASGMAIPGGNRIWLNPSRLSYHTISHELVHLLQCRNLGIPAGEKACDVFSLARHWTLNDEKPSYVKFPRHIVDEKGRIPEENAKLVFAAAREAITLRSQGLRNYISYFECELERRLDDRDTPHRSALRLLRTV